MFFDVTVKSTAAASHLHDDLRLFRFSVSVVPPVHFMSLWDGALLQRSFCFLGLLSRSDAGTKRESCIADDGQYRQFQSQSKYNFDYASVFGFSGP